MKKTAMCLALGAVVAFVPSESVQAQNKVQANDLVEIFEKMGGVHKGHRRAHARGLCVKGSFSPSQSDEFAGAKLLSSDKLPVLVRFSVGGANPASDERTPGTRGAGIRITLPDGSFHMFTGNNFPVFLGKDPDTFHGFLSTLLPDENGKRDPAKTGAFVAANPSVMANLAWQKSAQTPASYANTEFFGLHTFYYGKSDSAKTKFRWHVTPDLGLKTYSKEEAAKMEDGFLTTAMSEQLASGKVSFTLHASIGLPEDSDNDPSNQWPEDRPKVALGKITLDSLGEGECKNVNFDPNMLSAGFTPSDDPVLRMRSAAYAISFGKRLGNQ